MTVDEADQDLLVRLGSVAAQVDPVPELVLDLARLAWTVRGLDAELLRVGEQTTGVPAGVRSSTPQPCVRTFEGDDIALDVQVERVGGRIRVVGQVLPFPLVGGTVAVEHPDGIGTSVRVDDLGAFVVQVRDRSPLRVRIDLDARRLLVTPWFGC